jgi:predicted PP-loop superfamily ATPase
MLRPARWCVRRCSHIRAPKISIETDQSISRRIATTTAPTYSSQSLFTGNALKAHKGSIAVAMSGGIDSSVAALILKDQGYDCVGVFMTNWDTSDEAGDITCNINRDREHMKQVCERLNIPAIDVGHHLPLNAET